MTLMSQIFVHVMRRKKTGIYVGRCGQMWAAYRHFASKGYISVWIHKKQPIIHNNQGGVSGPAIKPIALLKVHEVYQVCKPHNIPIIGQGGVVNTNDAIEFLLAGATTVGLGTGLFYDPLCCQKINHEIVEYLDQNNHQHVNELIGSLQLHSN